MRRFGYGIYPGRAVWYLCGLRRSGGSCIGGRNGLGRWHRPTRTHTLNFHKGQTPVQYLPFNPFIYSVENCIPLVKLGQDESWQPDPDPLRRVPARGWREI